MRKPVGGSIKNFKLLRKIGYGAFAEVYKAKSVLEGYENIYYAIKRISKEFMKSKCERWEQRIRNEIEIHSAIKDPTNIVKFETSFEDDEFWYLVLEYCDGGSLHEQLKNRNGRGFSEEEACALIRQVIAAVTYLHSQKVIHRDLSLRNILLTRNGRVKIADFGLATVLCHPYETKTSVLGTANFMSPEVYQRDRYDFKVDFWAVGCVLYALLYGAPPFDDKNKNNIMIGTLNCKLQFPGHATAEARELLEDMLQKNPKERIDLKSALRYSFFKKHDQSGGKYESFQRRGDSGNFSVSSGSSSSSLTGQKTKKTSNERVFHSYERKPQIESQYDFQNYSSTAKHSVKEDSISRTFVKQRIEYPSNNKAQKSNLKNKIQVLPSRQEGYENGMSLERDPPERRVFNYKDRGKGGMTNEINNDRSESLFDVPVKSRPVTPSYPTEHMKLAEEISISRLTWENENSTSMPSKNMQSSCIKQSNSQDIFLHSISNTKNENYSSGYCDSNKNDRKHDLCKNPLTTARLKPKRSKVTSNRIVSILNDGHVCVEILKVKGGKNFVAEVCLISSDGKNITLYKPKKKKPPSDEPPPSINLQKVQKIDYETLSDIQWKKYYSYAKRFVDIIRAKTPRFTLDGEDASCVMMENYPNPYYEIKYNEEINGTKIMITEKKGIQTITDQNGDKLKYDLSAGIMKKLQHIFNNMKEECGRILHYEDCGTCSECSKIKSRIRATRYTVEGIPNACQRSLDDSKENASPRNMHTLDTTMAARKIHSGTVNADCSPDADSPQSHVSGLQTERRLMDSQIKRICSSVPEYVIAEYSGGIEMWISKSNGDVFFLDSNKERLDERTHPELMKRRELDLKSVLLKALSKEV